VAAVAAATFAVLAGGAATAVAADSVTVAISDVDTSGTNVTGVLTLNSKSVVQVDPSSLTATLDGDTKPISIQQAAGLDRRAMLVIDTSGSMGLKGMATVRAATAAYLRAVPSDVQVGVVSFATTAGVDLKPTRDRAAVQRVVNGLVARGDTSLYAGVKSAVGALGPKGDRSMVLLSDGADTVSKNRAGDLSGVTKSLRSAGIRVDVVRFKSDDPDATAALQGFAGANGGSVLSADNTAAVSAAFQASAKALEAQVPFEITLDKGLVGEHAIEIRGVAGGADFVVARTFTATTSPAPAPASPGAAPAVALPGVPAVAATSWFPLAAALLIAIGLFVIGGALLLPTLQTAREQRVNAIEGYVVGPLAVSRSERKVHTPALSEQLTAFGDRAMGEGRSRSWVLANVARADLPFRAGDWFLVNAAATVVAGALGYVLVRSAPTLGLSLGLLLGLVGPPLVLKFLAARRATRFERVLPDVLMLVATSLRSGFGLPQALDAVARDAAEPAAKEFSRALAETRIGTDVADALDHTADRMGSKSLLWTTMAIRIQRDVGGNLAETLLTTAQTLRERESLFRQVRALSAEGRLSAWILLALPIGMFFYLMLTNYDYVKLLWTTTLGLAMIIGSIVMMIIGIFWMRRVIRIEA
jgi:tight adherence protein B